MTPEQFITKWFRGNHVQRKKMEKDLKTLIRGDLQVGKWYWIQFGGEVIKAKLLDKTGMGLLIKVLDSIEIVPPDRLLSECDPPSNPLPSILLIVLGIAAFLWMFFSDNIVPPIIFVIIQGLILFKYKTYANS